MRALAWVVLHSQALIADHHSSVNQEPIPTDVFVDYKNGLTVSHPADAAIRACLE